MSKLIDLTGQRFERLVVIQRAQSKIDKNGNKRTMWECQCDCGNKIIASAGNLKNGNTKSCGCFKVDRTKELLTENLIGEKFGRLTVIEKVDNLYGRVAWKCKCDCGGERVANSNNLKRGFIKSCGCLIKENRLPEYAPRPFKHNMSRTRIYKIWLGMRKRCYLESHPEYYLYGGRGITICEEWSGDNGAENFIKWAYETGYDENAEFGECTIDRIDVNGNYEPSNCRWTNMKIQSNNRRSNILIQYNGETKTLMQWCELYQKDYSLVRQRMKREGWDFERAMFEEKHIR